ncbi:methyltransferase [Pholiota conissans]|uniref:tRNA N(3)-methylcytidine methyltransferase n=1 Tax=Pholiota conissans TaxID=109636 RepID=A0A9P5YRM9_9AGAR|nr:methyltransferase [Pholiota conissans]
MEAIAESSKKATSSVQNVDEEKPPFGSRFLTDEADVWSQNAWDHVPPPEDQVEAIAKSLLKQRLAPVPPEEKQKLNEKPAKHWDNFYKANAANFFRNRKWLHNEFPELVAATRSGAGPTTILEVGCGAGNSVFPLLAENKNTELRLHAYDYAAHAVKLVQNDPLYLSPPAGTIHAAVWDVTSSEGLPADIVPGTVDIVIMVFVMSALHPDEWGQAISNIHKILKPGGLILFRDYGRYDLTQLRFKGGRLLDENFYIRGDKTRVYFFELDELSLLFTGRKVSPETKVQHSLDEEERDDAGNELVLELDGKDPDSIMIGGSTDLSRDNQAALAAPTNSSGSPTPTNPPAIHPNLLVPLKHCPPHPLFTTEQLGIDRRLIVNRKRQLKMYRVWMQGKFRKL